MTYVVMRAAPWNQTAWFPNPTRPSLYLWTWASYLTSLCPISFFWKMEIKVAAPRGCCEDSVSYKHKVHKTGGPQEGHRWGSIMISSSSSAAAAALLKFSEFPVVHTRQSGRPSCAWGRGGEMFIWILHVEKDEWHLFLYKCFINKYFVRELVK